MSSIINFEIEKRLDLMKELLSQYDVNMSESEFRVLIKEMKHFNDILYYSLQSLELDYYHNNLE